MSKSKEELEEIIERKIYQIKHGEDAENNESKCEDLNLNEWNLEVLRPDKENFCFSEYPEPVENQITIPKIKLIFWKGKNTLVLQHEEKMVWCVKVFDHKNFSGIYQFIGKNTLDIQNETGNEISMGKWLNDRAYDLQELIENKPKNPN